MRYTVSMNDGTLVGSYATLAEAKEVVYTTLDYLGTIIDNETGDAWMWCD